MNKYDDMIDLPHYDSPTRRRMPVESRAAQFAPFAALSGHEEAISETARHTSGMVELDDGAAAEIDRKLQEILANGNSDTDITITFFCPDRLKSGGRMVKMTGTVAGLDKDGRHIIMKRGALIPIERIIDIEL